MRNGTLHATSAVYDDERPRVIFPHLPDVPSPKRQAQAKGLAWGSLGLLSHAQRGSVLFLVRNQHIGNVPQVCMTCG